MQVGVEFGGVGEFRCFFRDMEGEDDGRLGEFRRTDCPGVPFDVSGLQDDFGVRGDYQRKAQWIKGFLNSRGGGFQIAL
jgi:hypothetical protein